MVYKKKFVIPSTNSARDSSGFRWSGMGEG